MKPLRILYVVTTFPSVTETFIATQVADMIDRGHDCIIFSYNSSTDAVVHQLVTDYGLEKHTVTHFKNENSKWGILKGIFRFFCKHAFELNYKLLFSLLVPFSGSGKTVLRKAYWDMPVFLLRRKYDVVHCHFGFNGVKLARLKKLGILNEERCFVSFHGSDLTPSKVVEYRELYADLFIHFDGFTVNTPYLESILKRVHPNLKNVQILPVGFHEAYLKPYLDLPKSDVFTLVYCGRLMALKGPDRALAIVADLVQRGVVDIQLLMIGEGEEELNLKAQALQLGIEKHIQWLGALSQEAVFGHMSAASVFIYTGRTEESTGRAETQGLVIQEAQYFKLPVVFADVGGVKYGLIDGETGFLIAGNNLEAFVEKVLFLYQNPLVRKEMGARGHRWVQEHYRIQKLDDVLVAMYYGS